MDLAFDVRLKAYEAFDPAFLDLSPLTTATLSAAPDGRSLVADAGGGWTVTLGGRDLALDPDTGALSGAGRVGSITIALDGAEAVTVRGLHLATADLLSLAATGDGLAITDALLAGDDKITGSNGADYLRGGSGADRILGRQGDDVLDGGGGGDRLTGGGGADVFVFGEAALAAAAAGGARDVITDFDRNEGDVIDFAGLGSLSFHDGDSFHGTPGEVIATARPNGMLLQLDLDGNGAADLSVSVLGVDSIRSSDLALFAME